MIEPSECGYDAGYAAAAAAAQARILKRYGSEPPPDERGSGRNLLLLQHSCNVRDTESDSPYVGGSEYQLHLRNGSELGVSGHCYFAPFFSWTACLSNPPAPGPRDRVACARDRNV